MGEVRHMFESDDLLQLRISAMPPLGWLLAFMAYLGLIRILRCHRIKQLQNFYGYHTRASMARMTDHEAWEIQKTMSQLEFPFIFEKSLQFALFRVSLFFPWHASYTQTSIAPLFRTNRRFQTYGIPTISSTLTKTKQLSDARYSGKRYVDTCVLIGEFIAHDPATTRSRLAIARTKYLHHSYRRSGLVREEDMLYTLSLFATEPLRFIDRYEWRPVTDLERCALGVFWKSVGDALGIDYAAFVPPAAGKHAGHPEFQDGIHWLDEISAWAQEYEKRAMTPAQTNHDTADQTTAILTYPYPQSLKCLGRWFVSSMMDDRLRHAMMYEPAPVLAQHMFAFVFAVRRVFLRYFALPRPNFMRSCSFTESPDPITGASHVVTWQAEPFYVQPTLWNRWLSPAAIMSRLVGFPLPGDGGLQYHPDGYDLATMGPDKFKDKGRDYLEAEMSVLEQVRRGQCPFSG